MPNHITLKAIRDALPHYLSDEVGAVAGLTLPQLQQIVAGTLTPSAAQMIALARRMHLLEKLP